MKLEAVVFDLGGVVVDSPLHAIARAIVAVGEAGAWSRLERGELAMEAFFDAFEADCRGEGIAVDARRMMGYIASGAGPRPQMLEAIRRIRDHGLRTAALTNNWQSEDRPENPLRELFHVFVESSVVGLRKPDPRIYELVCRELGVEPSAAAFLDDIGRNLKSARALGMTTIKVDEPDSALRDLEQVLGFGLL
jgi:epoxide hydrolase-like predicted phosphatase